MIKHSVSRINKLFLMLLGVVATSFGCSGETGEERPSVVPVTGVVMYNNNPVPGAMVSFMADGAPRAATGITNEKGEFQLTMFDPNDGAIPGTNKITVSKVEAAAQQANTDEALLNDPTAMTDSYLKKAGSDGKLDEGPKSLIPGKYATEGTSPLSEEVKTEGENRFILQLAD